VPLTRLEVGARVEACGNRLLRAPSRGALTGDQHRPVRCADALHLSVAGKVIYITFSGE
jgi:hypothetical protein